MVGLPPIWGETKRDGTVPLEGDTTTGDVKLTGGVTTLYSPALVEIGGGVILGGVGNGSFTERSVNVIVVVVESFVDNGDIGGGSFEMEGLLNPVDYMSSGLSEVSHFSGVFEAFLSTLLFDKLEATLGIRRAAGGSVMMRGDVILVGFS